MKHSGKFGSKAGVTLVELLVVILIVIILSVTLLPLLGPFVTKAKYTADAIPQVGNLRTKAELYRVEENVLPGVKHSSGDVVLDAPGGLSAPTGGNSEDGGTSYLGKGFLTQGFGTATNNAGMTVYHKCMMDTVSSSNAVGTVTNGIDSAYHFAEHLDMNYEDLTGKNLRPNHVQYWSSSAGYDQGSYAYAIGIFGDGNGLPSGTGYAVFEVHNADPDVQQKSVLTWEQWKEPSEAQQITFTSPGNGNQKNNGNFCWIAGKNQLFGAAGAFKTAMDDMKQQGWE